MNNSTRRQDLVLYGVLAAVLAFCLFTANAIPYSVTDDLQWGMEEGLFWWRTGALNGRYVGNLFAILMCRSEAGKILIMGGCMFALPLLMAVLAARGRRENFLPLFLACCTGIFLMPPVMWIETYGWVSGFGNYVISTAAFLLWLVVLRHVAEHKTRPILWAAVLLPLTAATCLFVENLTVLFFGAALILVLYSLWDRALLLPFLACLAGAAVGVFLMFFNGLFTDLATDGSALNGLRALTFSIEDGIPGMIRGISKQYFVSLLPISFLRGVHMAWPIAAITAAAFWNSRFRVLSVSAVIPILFNLYVMKTETFRTVPGILTSCICWALPLLALAVQRDDMQTKIRRGLLFLASPLSLLPLAATPTLGQRLYFFPMAMLVLVAADVCLPLLKKRWGMVFAAVLLAALACFWGRMLLEAWECTLVREEQITQAVETGADTVVLPTDRYDKKIWYTRNPWNAEFASYYRRYFGVPEDMTLVFLPVGSQEYWPEILPEHWERRVVLEPFVAFTPSLPVPPT